MSARGLPARHAPTHVAAWLTSAESCPADPGDVKWNFGKFLVGRDGKVIARFRSKVKPTDAAVTDAIEKAL